MDEISSTGADEAIPRPLVNLGWRMRLGVLLPSVNTIAEPQLEAMRPPGVSIHTTRLKLTGSSEEELLAMAASLEAAAQLLADAEPHRLLFHCTATTTYDVEMPARLRRRMEAATGIRSLVTSEAIIAALAALGARKVVLITPYIAPINEREVAFLAHHNVEVVSEYGLGLPGGRAFAEVEPERWRRIVLARRHPAADAYFISCAQIRVAEMIDTLERDLDRPVLTSNQAALWFSLRDAGIMDSIEGFGRLFTR